MRRADRLFQLIQILRSHAFITATRLAKRLDVSERTIYRDVHDLMASGVPIKGEAGMGYVLAESFDLPPLMFTGEEIEALVLGARVVQDWGDDELGRASRSILEKVAAVVPEELRPRIAASPLFSARCPPPDELGHRLRAVRDSIRERRKVRMGYQREDGVLSERTVQSICLTLRVSGWQLGAWCELRRDFRTFRLDRIRAMHGLDETFDDGALPGLDAFLSSIRTRDHEQD